MKAIFLCEKEEKLRSVYPEETIACLQRKTGLDHRVYTKAMLPEMAKQLTDVQYIFSTWGMPQLTEEEIKAYLPKLEAVFYAAGTVQKFARPFLNCGVKVFSAWAANGIPVAEYVTAQIVLANKGFYQTSACMSSGEYKEAKALSQKYRGNYGAKIGIIGAGMIGKMVIQRLKAYHLEVMVFDPFLLDEKAKELGVTKTTLEQLFEKCLVVSNHLANNEATKGMLNYALFSRMLPYATFLNTGRGAQVVEADLVQILKERKDLTAILDVTHPEPPKEDHAFYDLPNCILTPHIAGSLGDEVHRMAEYMVEEFETYTSGQECRYEVTEKMLETMA